MIICEMPSGSYTKYNATWGEEAIKRGIIPYVWDINNPNRYGTGDDLQGRKVKKVRGGLYIIGGKLVYSHPNR